MTYIKKIFTERNLVIILFVIALCTFSLAQEDTRRIERKHHDLSVSPSNVGDSVLTQLTK